MSENLIERYFTDIGEVRSTRSNVAETPFYPALERLFSDIGKGLSPDLLPHPSTKVRTQGCTTMLEK